MSDIISLIGIVVGLVILIYLAFKGYSIVWVAPVCAIVVAAFGCKNLLGAYMGDCMNGLAGFICTNFPLFFLGAVFGKIMDITGAARSLANKLVKLIGSQYALLAVVLPCLLMTYGGISLFVVVFVIYPMGYAIYREADLPRQLLPGAIAYGVWYYHDRHPRVSPGAESDPYPVLRHYRSGSPGAGPGGSPADRYSRLHLPGLEDPQGPQGRPPL